MTWINAHLGEIIFAFSFFIAALLFALQRPKVCCRCQTKEHNLHKLRSGKYICSDCYHRTVDGL